MGICVIAGCNNVAKYGFTCSLQCGRKYKKINTLENLESPKKNDNGFGDIHQKTIYYDSNVNLVELIKYAIVQYKMLPVESKQLFFKNKIEPIIKQINGDTPKWNAVCIHLKNEYSKPEYRFILEAFKSIGMVIYS